jgi:hypothetical protein
MTARSRQSIRLRIKRIGSFVAIVWGVAASFVMLDLLALMGTDLLFEKSESLSALSLSPAVRQSRVCQAPARDQALAVGASAAARTAAWQLGVEGGSGTYARLRLAEESRSARSAPLAERLAGARRVAERSDTETTRLAAVLKVPRPADFEPVNVASSIVEFVGFIEADASETARMLAVLHGPETCELYKLGSYWGYSMLARIELPGERNVYADEILYYARRLELPDDAWQPMVARTSSGAAPEQLESETAALTESLTRHLRGGR